MEPPELPNPYREQAIDEAQAWVARFAPLVLQNAPLNEPEVRQRMNVIHQLRGTGAALRDRLRSVGGPNEVELTSTMAAAVDQLDSVEDDLRRRLAAVAPGDPDGIVNLDLLRDKLAERAAQAEAGMMSTLAQPDQLELEITKGNKAGAVGTGLFALFWNGFTLVHAAFMITGMFMAFGWVALFLLLFYAIFFGAGAAITMAAINTASTESVSLDGLDLTVNRKFGKWVRTKKYRLGARARAEVGMTTAGVRSGNRSRHQPAILLPDEHGNQITLGQHGTDIQRTTAVQKINDYLAAQ